MSGSACLWKNNFEEFYATKLATRVSTRNGRYSPGFDTCRNSLRPWRASAQERFRKAANVAVMIVERRKELLICGQVPFGAPLQMASK